MASLPTELQDFMRPIIVPEVGIDYQEQFRDLNPPVEFPYSTKVLGISARWALLSWSLFIVLLVPMLTFLSEHLYPYNEGILYCVGAVTVTVFLIILLALVFKKISVLDYMSYALMFIMLISTIILVIIGLHIASLITDFYVYSYYEDEIFPYVEKDLAYAIIAVVPLLACTAAYFITERAFDDISNTMVMMIENKIEEIELEELESMENSLTERLLD